MNFDLTEEQKAMVESASQFARKSSPVKRFRTLRDDPLGWQRDVWRQMAEMGWLGIGFAETVGGLGGSFVDFALVLEQLGTRLVPEPLIASVVLGGGALQRLGDAEQQRRWLQPMIAGEKTLALGYAERQSRHALGEVATTAEVVSGGYRLKGEKVFVLNGHAADALVVSTHTKAGVTLFVVEKGAKGLTVEPIKTTDGGRAAMVKLDGVEVPASHRLGPEGQGHEALEAVIDHGAAAACAEGVGILRALLEMTREHLCTREQFGAKLGSFQALQHRLAEIFIEVELAKSASILAAVSVAQGDAAERKASISAAKAQLAMSGRFVSQQAIQLHGGIGITDEHDVGLYFKRMLVLNALFGDEDHHVARYASIRH